VNITDFFEIWKAPVRDRLRIVLNELGMSLAGRGDDLNGLLLRANPSLLKARRALAIVVAQRKSLGRSIAQSNRALAALAHDPGSTRRFIREAAKTSRLTAAHDRAIGAGIAGLPPLLTRSRDALTELDALSRSSRPLLADLHSSAPALDNLTADAVPFAELALPSVRSLRPALKQGKATVSELGPFARGLQRFTKSADPAGRLQSDLQVSLRDSGAYENLLKLFYVGAASTSRYDAVSHLDPSHLIETGCSAYTTKPDPNCDSHYVKQGAATAKKQKSSPAGTAAKPDDRPASKAPTADPTPAKPKTPAPVIPTAGIGGVDSAIHDLLDYLLGT
jgi:ABC-type transporter Mla subunit MlaD